MWYPIQIAPGRKGHATHKIFYHYSGAWVFFCGVTAFSNNEKCEQITAKVARHLFPGTRVPLYRYKGNVFKVYSHERFGANAPNLVENLLQTSEVLEKKIPGVFVKAIGQAVYRDSGKAEPALIMEDLQAAGLDDLEYFVMGKGAAEVTSILDSFRHLVFRLAEQKIILLDHRNAANFMTDGKTIKVIDLEGVAADATTPLASQRLEIFRAGVKDNDGVGFSEVLCRYYYDMYTGGHHQIIFYSKAWLNTVPPQPIDYETFRNILKNPAQPE